ncbi:MAG: hypothetical protein FWC99_02245 [Coriobacteriia bacterium]|nr:hypothetical protein [Coriobacteriia bacterium]
MIKSLIPAGNVALRVFLFSLILSLGLFAAINVGYALPGAETAEDAAAELSDRSEEEIDALAEEQAEARTAAAIEAAAGGTAPIQAVWIYLMEEAEEERIAVTLVGSIDPYTPLPAQVKFYFIEDFELGVLEELDFDTRELLNGLEYEATPSELEEFENLTTYSFTLTEGHTFSANFAMDAVLFDTESEMGDAPLASFTFVPPNDLYGLVVGFVSPSPDRVGAGGQEEVVLLADTEDGEIYGIVRENVPGGVLQEYLIAFGSREARDAALAEAAAAAEISQETTPSAMAWFTTPTGLIIMGSTLVLLAATTLIVVLIVRQKKEDFDIESDTESDEVDSDDKDNWDMDATDPSSENATEEPEED